MVGILLIGHGHMAQEMVESAKMIMGEEIPAYAALPLILGEDLEDYERRFLAALHALNTGDGVLVLADFFAGTPANVALRNLREQGYGLLTGMNLAMVIEALSNREGFTMEEVKENAMEAARVSMVDINERLK